MNLEYVPSMNRRFKTAQSIPAFLAVLLLLVASSSHIHLRYCLDGDEFPVSIHFETDDSHPSDVDIASGNTESDQTDIESELSLDTLLDKNSKTSIDAVAITSINSLTIKTASLTSSQPRLIESLPKRRAALSPPSRAPPEIV